MLKKISRLSIMCMLFMHSTTQSYTLQDIKNLWKKTSQYTDTGLKIGAGVGALLGTYYIAKNAYNFVQMRANDKIENEIVDVITLALTSNYSISRLPESDREIQFRKKAQIINARKRIMEKLSDIANGKNSCLSIKHQTNLRKTCDQMEAMFALVDVIRECSLCIPNPYEQEYTNKTFMDALIEKNIVDSIIFSSKPEDELTKSDFKKKEKALQRRENIKKKLEAKLSYIWLKKITCLIDII